MGVSTTPPTDDAALATVLTRIEVKLDNALSQGQDHELRLRIVEARKTVSPRDLWLGLGGAVAAGASVATIVRTLFP